MKTVTLVAGALGIFTAGTIFGAWFHTPVKHLLRQILTCSFLKYRKQQVRTLILGLDGAGKSTILYRLKHGSSVCSSCCSTIGFNVETIEFKSFVFDMWDIGGQERIRQLWPYYFSKSEVIIFVIDSADKDRFDQARAELDKLLHAEELCNTTLLILANKQDAPGAAPPSDIAASLQTLPALRSRRWRVQPSAAPSGAGLREGFEWISERLVERRAAGRAWARPEESIRA